MIDTVHSYLTIRETGEELNLNQIAYLLQDFGSLKNCSQGYISGSLKNLKIKCKPTSISVQGSFPKFFFGNNIEQLTRATIVQATEMLSDALHLPFEQAIITRVDIGFTFQTKLPPISYFSSLQTLPRYFRSTDGTTLYYTQKGSKLAFYDKAKEVRNFALIPTIYRGSNLLKYELRLSKPKLQLHPALNLAKLTEEEVYIKAVDLWADKYFSINKNKGINHLENMMITKPSDIKENLAALAAQTIGAEALKLYLKSLKQQGAFKHNKQYSRAQKEVADLLNKPGLQQDSDSTEELDKQVKQVLRYIR